MHSMILAKVYCNGSEKKERKKEKKKKKRIEERRVLYVPYDKKNNAF